MVKRLQFLFPILINRFFDSHLVFLSLISTPSTYELVLESWLSKVEQPEQPLDLKKEIVGRIISLSKDILFSKKFRLLESPFAKARGISKAEAVHMMAVREVELVDFVINWLFGDETFFRLVRVLPRATMGFYFEVVQMLGLSLGMRSQGRKSQLGDKIEELELFEGVPSFLNRFCGMVYYSKEFQGQVWLLLLAKSKKLKIKQNHLFG